MAHYRTCTGCLFRNGPCAERKKISEKIAGLGLTSVAFKCGWKRPHFRVGDPVYVDFTFWFDGEPDNRRLEGHISHDSGESSKVVVFVDPKHFDEVFETTDGMTGNGHMKLSRRHVRRREGVPASMCRVCGRFGAIQGHDEHFCFDLGNLQLGRVA